MEYRSLGRSGLVVSELGLGGNNFGRRLNVDQSREVVHAALDHGVTFIDTAEAYGTSPGDSETVLGEVLRGRRDQIVLASKFGHPTARISTGPAEGTRAGRRAIRTALEGSLRRLRTDHLDLYQLHRWDPHTPLEETLGELATLVDEGKIRYVGHSTLHSWQLAEIDRVSRDLGRHHIVSAQYEWNLLDRWVETDLAETAEHFGVGVLPYFPLAQGLLTGKIADKGAIPADARLHTTPELVTDGRLETVARLASWADARGHTLLELAFGMLTTHSAVGSVIAGASSPAQVAANVRAIAFKPSAEERSEVDALAPAPRWPA